jgi:peptide/nickel transport system substrate-binding protein
MLQGIARIAAVGSALVVGSSLALSQTPKRGGILHYAVTTEPPNYDCHGNTNYGVSQGVFSHYSRLLKDAGDWKESKIVGDVAESWEIAPTAEPSPSSSAGA